jgi:hypothetical protein
MIRKQWKPADEGRLASVEVSAGPWVQSERMPHDRHVRFSIGVGLKLHAGFDRLSRISVQDRDGMSWQYISAAASVQVLKAQEKRVLDGSQTRNAVVLDRGSR